MGLKHRLRRICPERFFPLPVHPYEAQFSPDMDLPEMSRASEIVLIASTPRCGSHFLGHMLKDLGGFGVPLEYLNPSNAPYWNRRFGTEDLFELFPHFILHRTSSNGRFVLKAHWEQFESFSQRVDELTNGLGIAKGVWIFRRNLLPQAISLIIARQTGVWIAGAPKTGEAHYDANQIAEAARWICEQNTAWKAYLQSREEMQTVAIAYEDLLKGDTPASFELTRILGLDGYLVPASRTARQSTGLNEEWKQRFANDAGGGDRWILDEKEWLLEP